VVENNLALQDDLYQLRQETQDVFNQAKALESRWRELDRQQKEQYQVYLFFSTVALS
jgi:ESCRT-I complex subunit VPS37